MSAFATLMAGIGIGLATSVIAWLLTIAFLAPRVMVRALNPIDADMQAFKFQVVNRRRLRGLSDVSVNCTLYIPHHLTQQNVLALKTTSGHFPFVPAKWDRVVTISMDPASLSDETGKPELAKRLDELQPQRSVDGLSSLREIFTLIPGSRIEVVIFASDPLSGVRRTSHGSLTPNSL